DNNPTQKFRIFLIATMLHPVFKFVVLFLTPFLLLLWLTSPDLWSKISSSVQIAGENPSSLLNLTSGLLFSGEAIVKRLTCNNLDLDVVDYALLTPAGEKILMSSLPSLEKTNSVPILVPVMPPPAPTCTPWLLTGLILMGLNAYFPQLSPVFPLWSPLQEAVPVLYWAAYWWFFLLGWEPNLVSLAPPLLHNMPAHLVDRLADTEESGKSIIKSFNLTIVKWHKLQSFFQECLFRNS
ncbi:hypothetical protein DSO57_1027903, partial [Entomophthora muscae]